MPSKFNVIANYRDPYAAGRGGESELTKQYPKLSGFLQGLMGRAPDEVGGGSVLDEDTQSSRKLQALGAKYGFPIGTLAGMLPFGGGIAKAPSVVAGSRTAQKGIVKLPGGNWLSGSVEDAVRGLKKLAPAQGRFGDPVPYHLLEPSIEGADGAVNNWIDSQLVKKYIKNEMATERDPLRLMADAWPEKKAAKLAEVQSRIDALAERTRQLARERGQPEHTLTEMRQLMIPLEKEKALIEGTEGLHFRPEPSTGEVRPDIPNYRLVAKNRLAQDWESASDAIVNVDRAGDLLHPSSITPREDLGWLQKVPPDTNVYSADYVGDLGFNHLIDELRNSLNPESGLPKELLMRYQDLPKVTVPQAAERVAQINAWRAAQKREADLLTANNAATVLHKDYPEKGLKWVEMKKSEQFPEGWADMTTDGSRFRGPNGEIVGDDPRHKLLADALKYEGDQMAHCVGGYCPDVLEGRSRIFSLRDAKGKPHTTIEVRPGEYARADLSEDQFELVRDLARKRGVVPNQSILREALPELPDPPSIIKQIKGYKNAKPDDEYLPYVQDFVRSGKWSDVGDFHNTDLLRLKDFEGRMHPELMKRARTELGEYATQAELEALHAPRPDTPMHGFASGGLVSTGYNPSLVNARAAQLEAELFN